ncbi:MAG: glycosyl hydrolase family 28-related protein [Phycisphaerae bacterium]|nr:glycosyl hydrolase family 28-related protein [Phycisphaerae bacterium]
MRIWTFMKTGAASLLAMAIVGMGIPAAMGAEHPGAGLIPAERLSDWRPGVTVGVPGGIPKRTKLIDVTKEPYKADNTGKKDAAAAIQKAVNDAKAKDVVYLPAGTYRMEKSIRVSYKSNLTIRGDGPEKTKLMLYPGCGAAFDIGSCASGADWSYGNRKKVSVTGSPKRGATKITVGDTTFLKDYPNQGIGALVQFSLKNDPKLPVMPQGSWEYLRKQTARIVAKTATTVTISPGLLFDLPETLAPLMRPAGKRWVEYTGVEDLTVDGANSSSKIGIRIDVAYGCWLKNVSILNITNYHVWLTDSIQSEVRHSTLAKRKGSGSNGAGILFSSCSYCLIEDNVLIEQFPHVEANNTSGSVFAYNACYDSAVFVGNHGMLGCSIDTNHGAHSSFNLYEGNVAQRFQSDGYHGSASHDTAFRNWFHATSDKTDKFWICVNLNRFTRAYSIVGNILGRKGYTWEYQVEPTGFAYDKHYIYSLGYPNMGNGSSNGKTAQLSKGKPWEDWKKMKAGGKHPGPGGYQELDLDVPATTLLKGNYNYKDNAVPESESIGKTKLPPSLYLSKKPAWFGDLKWPAFGPDTTFEKNKIPAQVRYEKMMKAGKEPQGGTGK